MQDPLSSVSHQTYQAHRNSRHLHQAQGQSAPSPNPEIQRSSPDSTSATTFATLAAPTVSAAPELRDFKKEATAFVPSALAKQKRPGVSSSAGGGGGEGRLGRVDAAPLTEEEEDDQINQKGSSGVTGGMTLKPDLLGSLRGQFPFASSSASAPKVEKEIEILKKKKKNKYMEEIGDIL
ncbi:hypothetical protein K435DRAFT_787358 [Dendrothele bispora CBS 962.96]|uniref:Uncharacterized protein n=1 Tax=Dendrothele bispora (strain CBS 962.96) TaxID=1314807 RepID=A0A4S8KKQ0_DENBC|nr:hypothetical protein K435DRAFT_787358 [Dendrothele bispora CBS 962.96]